MATREMTRVESERINRRNLCLGVWDALACFGLLCLLDAQGDVMGGVEWGGVEVGQYVALVWLAAFAWRQLTSGQFRRRKDPGNGR
jgi:hypothetical protein